MSHYIKLYLHLFLVLFIMSDIFIDLYFGSIINEKKNQHTPSSFILKSVPGSVMAARWADSSCSAAVSEAEAEAEQSVRTECDHEWGTLPGAVWEPGPVRECVQRQQRVLRRGEQAGELAVS